MQYIFEMNNQPHFDVCAPVCNPSFSDMNIVFVFLLKAILCGNMWLVTSWECPMIKHGCKY